MSLFLLLGVPITCILVFALTRNELTSSVLVAFARGVLTWIIGYIIFFFILYVIELEYTPKRIYLFYAFTDFAWWIFVAIVGHILSTKPYKQRPAAEDIASAAAFVLGVLLITPVIDLIRDHQILNAYNLFLLPSLRIVLLLVFISVVTLFREFSRIVRLFAYLIILVLPLLLAVVPLLYVLQRHVWSYALTSCFVLLAGGLFTIVLKRER